MRRTMTVVLFLAAAGLGGCSGDSTGPSDGIAGAYALRTINGDNLPYTIVQIGADKIEILNDTVTLSDGGTFTQQGTLRVTQSGIATNQSYSDAGSYSRDGTAISFVFNSDGSSGTGTLSGNKITVALDGFSYVYQK